MNKIPVLLDVFVTMNISQNYMKIEKWLEQAADYSSVILLSFNGTEITKEEDNYTVVNKAPNLVSLQTSWVQNYIYKVSRHEPGCNG